MLSLGEGEGRNAAYLAGLGHRVVAVDPSPVGLAKARQLAAGRGLSVETVCADLSTYPVESAAPEGGWAGVVSIFCHLPRRIRVPLHAAVARALRPGGVLALDLCDLRFASVRRDAPPYGRVEDDWAIVTRYEVPSPDRFVRHITTFVRRPGDGWRRHDERHDNVLVDTAGVPDLLAGFGVAAEIRPSFGDERLPEGLVAVVGNVGRPGLEPGPEA